MLVSANFLMKYSLTWQPTTLPNLASGWNCKRLLQRQVKQSAISDENNNREALSVSYLAVGILSEKASGRTGWVNSKQIPPRCQGNVLFRHQELQLSIGQRWLAVRWGGRAIGGSAWCDWQHERDAFMLHRNIVSAGVSYNHQLKQK